jgi:uncharacterized protein YdhG (YjbR/CyaY superfamily)
MKTQRAGPKDIDDYIADFPGDVREILEKIRTTIRKAAPQAEETISYQIPTFTLKGNLVHFAAFKEHIGFYPAPSGVEEFQQELSVYNGAKGSVQFPFDKPVPFALISKIVRFRVEENLKKAETIRKPHGTVGSGFLGRKRRPRSPRISPRTRSARWHCRWVTSISRCAQSLRYGQASNSCCAKSFDENGPA